MFGASACEGTDSGTNDTNTQIVVEEPEDSSDAENSEQTDAADLADEVAPEFDENGNPTGEYAKYLWEQEQMEEAMNSLAEDAMREQYEEDYETHVFPLD